MNDEQRLEDERIASVARKAYNTPPSTPREEMWSVIEARLEAAASVPSVGSPDPGGVIRFESAAIDRARRRLSWWIGVAAALVIGLGLGRLSLTTDPAEPGVAARSDSPPTSETTPDATMAAAPDPRDILEADPSPGESGGDVPVPPAAELPRDRPTGASSGPYVAVTREHLDRSESFLTGVRVDLASGSADAEFEAWARSLLSRTRLLLASPVGRDPETRRLLEDLELMLAQVVVMAATSDPAEIRLLGEGLEGGDLLRRLRFGTSETIDSGDARAPRSASL